MYVCMCMRVCVCVYMCVRVCVCIRIHIERQHTHNIKLSKHPSRPTSTNLNINTTFHEVKDEANFRYANSEIQTRSVVQHATARPRKCPNTITHTLN